MNRRFFLRSLAVAGSAAAASFPAPAISQGKMKLRMVTSWQKDWPGLWTTATRFAERINRASGGRYTIEVFPAGEVVHPLKCLDAVRDGTVDLYHSADYYYQDRSKAYNFFTAVPGGFTASEMDAWIQHGGGQALWDEVGAEFGVKHLPGGNTGMQGGGWFKQPIESADDFNGLTMRIPGLGGAVIEELGGTAVFVNGTEIVPALESGTIDATEWVGPWADLAQGLYAFAKTAHYPSLHEPGSMLSIGVSRTLWDELDEADRAMFTACALAENDHSCAEFTANNQPARETLEEKHGVRYVPFPREVFTTMAEAARDVVADVASADRLTKKVYDAYIAFRARMTRWSEVSEAVYYGYRNLVTY